MNVCSCFILNDIEHKQLFYDSKTILQEMVQAKYKETLVYELLKEEGPAHNKSFEVCVKIGDEEIGRGLGRTKKAAEQVAAAEEEAKKTLADAAAEVTRTRSELSLYERPEDGAAAVEVEE